MSGLRLTWGGFHFLVDFALLMAQNASFFSKNQFFHFALTTCSDELWVNNIYNQPQFSRRIQWDSWYWLIIKNHGFMDEWKFCPKKCPKPKFGLSDLILVIVGLVWCYFECRCGTWHLCLIDKHFKFLLWSRYWWIYKIPKSCTFCPKKCPKRKFRRPKKYFWQ